MAIKSKVYNQKADTVGEVELPKDIFDIKVNEALVHQAMVTQFSNERQVLAHTKDRSEVRGGGRKPWRQKGTGRARVGSNRSPIWIGGGVTFGPRNERNFKKKINKKMKKKAIFMVLSDKVHNNSLYLLDKLEIGEYKTKSINDILKSFEEKIIKLKKQSSSTSSEQVKGKKKQQEKRSVLLINSKKDERAKCSGRNLVGAKLINLDNINILDLLKYKNLILTKDSIKILEEKYLEKK